MLNCKEDRVKFKIVTRGEIIVNAVDFEDAWRVFEEHIAEYNIEGKWAEDHSTIVKLRSDILPSIN